MTDFESVATGLLFPEGPVIMADGSVLIVEIRRQTVSRVAPDGKVSVIADTGGGPNGLAIGPDGALYICNNGGFEWYEAAGTHIPGHKPHDYIGGRIQRLDLQSGALSTLYSECNGKPLKGPNDLVFDTTGGFWFTDHGKSTPEHRDHGALHYAKADGSLITLARGDLTAPNGVGLSPDESVVYWADTTTGRLWAADIEAPGKLKASLFPWMPGRVIATLPDYQLLDSLKVEQSGKICVGTIINGGITIFDPDGKTEHVAFPELAVTNLCFGGADMRDVWVTGSSSGTLYKGRWPRSGLKLAYNG